MRSRSIRLYTWKRYIAINQCCLNKNKIKRYSLNILHTILVLLFLLIILLLLILSQYRDSQYHLQCYCLDTKFVYILFELIITQQVANEDLKLKKECVEPHTICRWHSLFSFICPACSSATITEANMTLCFIWLIYSLINYLYF